MTCDLITPILSHSGLMVQHKHWDNVVSTILMLPACIRRGLALWCPSCKGQLAGSQRGEHQHSTSSGMRRYTKHRSHAGRLMTMATSLTLSEWTGTRKPLSSHRQVCCSALQHTLCRMRYLRLNSIILMNSVSWDSSAACSAECIGGRVPSQDSTLVLTVRSVLLLLCSHAPAVMQRSTPDRWLYAQAGGTTMSTTRTRMRGCSRCRMPGCTHTSARWTSASGRRRRA